MEEACPLSAVSADPVFPVRDRWSSLLLTLAVHHGHALSQVWRVLLGALCGIEVVTV